MARDYTAELVPKTEGLNFCAEYRKNIRTVLITIQGILNSLFPQGAEIIGLVIAFCDEACPAS